MTYRIELGPISPERWVRLRLEAPEPPPPPPATTASIVFAAALQGEAAANLYTVSPDGTGLTRITDTAGGELFPTWSPDRTTIAFVRDGQLFTMDAGGGAERLVASQVGRDGVGVTAAAWSPDGSRLAYPYPRPAFVVGEGEDAVDESYDTTIHFVNADGTGDTALPEPDHRPPGYGTLIEPAWASTGELAINALDDCPDCAGGSFYFRIGADGSGYTSTPLVQPYPIHGVDWSPDATRWVYTAQAQYAQYESAGAIATATPDLAGALTLTTTGAWFPRFSPDGSAIAFLRADGLYVMNADGSGQRRIVEASGIRGLDW